VSTLIIDNYDSYTYNLYQMVREADQADADYNSNDDASDDKLPTTVLSDGKLPTTVLTIPSKKFSTLDELETHLKSINFPPPSHPNLTIIISPGPGDPRNRDDLGISGDIIESRKVPDTIWSSVPTLGVCLGHQLMAFKGEGDDHEVIARNQGGGRHGVLTGVANTDGSTNVKTADVLKEMFRLPGEESINNDHSNNANSNNNIASDDDLLSYVNVVLYHSLTVTLQSLTSGWVKPTLLSSSTYDNVGGDILALRHERLPRYGVQFHPESVGARSNHLNPDDDSKGDSDDFGRRLLNEFRASSRRWYDSGRGLFQSSSSTTTSTTTASSTTTPITTDDALVKKTTKVTITELPKSYRAPIEVFEGLDYHNSPKAYWLDSSSGGRFSFFGSGDNNNDDVRSTHVVTYRLGSDGVTVKSTEGTPATSKPSEKAINSKNILEFLEQSMGELAYDEAESDFGDIPFDFRGGYVGYLGYEVRANTRCYVTGGTNSGTEGEWTKLNGKVDDDEPPTAGLIFADRTIVYDHLEKTYVASEAWMTSVERSEAKRSDEPFEHPQGQSHSIFESHVLRCVEAKRAVIFFIANSATINQQVLRRRGVCGRG